MDEMRLTRLSDQADEVKHTLVEDRHDVVLHKVERCRVVVELDDRLDRVGSLSKVGQRLERDGVGVSLEGSSGFDLLISSDEVEVLQ
jgi:hypothetical protein